MSTPPQSRQPTPEEWQQYQEWLAAQAGPPVQDAQQRRKAFHKRVDAWFGVGVAVLFIVWLLSPKDPAPASSTSTSTSSSSTGSTPGQGLSSSATPATDAAFLGLLKSRGMMVKDSATVIAAAHMICDGFDQGLDPKTFSLSFARTSGLKLSDSGYVMGAAVGMYCPQHRNMVGG